MEEKGKGARSAPVKNGWAMTHTFKKWEGSDPLPPSPRSGATVYCIHYSMLFITVFISKTVEDNVFEHFHNKSPFLGGYHLVLNN